MPARAAALLFALTLAAAPAGQDAPRFMMEPARVGTLKAIPADDDLPPRTADAPLRASRDRDSRTIPAGLVEKPFEPERRSASRRDAVDDFVDLPSDYGRDAKRKPRDDDRPARRDRSPTATLTGNKLGDTLDNLFDGEKRRKMFEGDHGFDQFASPISNPFLFEDPRALSEVRPVFIYQKVPNPQPNFQGGNLWFLGARGSLAITDRVSVTVNKLGGIAVNPREKSVYDSEFGLAEIWLGPKVTLLRDPEFGTILAAGGIFQIPVGSKDVFQDTGSFGITPYASIGQTLLRTRFGSLNAIATGGYSFSVNNARSDYFYASGHLDYDIGDLHKFYPILELNWFQYTTNGTERFISGEGGDLINFGGLAKGASLVTGAVGGRVKLTESAQVGAAFELPLIGNKDYKQYRFTVDFIFRY